MLQQQILPVSGLCTERIQTQPNAGRLLMQGGCARLAISLPGLPFCGRHCASTQTASYGTPNHLTQHLRYSYKAARYRKSKNFLSDEPA